MLITRAKRLRMRRSLYCGHPTQALRQESMNCRHLLHPKWQCRNPIDQE